MAANRKLLGEIQQVLKKVDEGVELFDEIWGKVYASESQALKEKYENDLKKEIKKLQRFRDQIKSWIGNNDIKDKNQLVEARKVIETKMEQFKICEKDTKTKAYSKEGLAREARSGPKDAQREEKKEWLNECLEKLYDLNTTVEAEKEKLLSNTRNKIKNKDLAEKMDNRIQKHKWHISKIELIIRLLDNEELEPSSLDTIKDSLEYYLETAVDDDGELDVEHEFDIYEDLDLDSYNTSLYDYTPKTPIPGKLNDSNEELDQKSIKDISQEMNLEKPVLPLVSEKIQKEVIPKESKIATDQPIQTPIMPKTGPAKSTSEPINKVPNQSPLAQNLTQSQPQHSSPNVQETSQSSQIIIANDRMTNEKLASNPKISMSEETPNPSQASLASSQIPIIENLSNSIQSLKLSPSPVLNKTQDLANIVKPVDQQIKPSSNQPQPLTPQPIEIPQQSLINSSQMSNEMASMLGLLKQSAFYSVEPEEKTNIYTPKNVYPNFNPLFPTTPLYQSTTEVTSLFEKLPLDSLFFSFYFQTGTYQQHLAAKKLKKNSWRFHKKYTTWFQRHAEPKMATPEFEEGTYLYFDYESGWCQRIKSEFKFEYLFLEDEVNA